jgi:bifunctional non-homologous end joining protein LigD
MAEAVACGDDGVPSFELLPHRRHDGRAFLYAFDLIELEGDDLRRYPIERCKADPARLLGPAGPGLRLNDCIADVNGATIFELACKLGHEAS